jgi:hypothetical protein
MVDDDYTDMEDVVVDKEAIEFDNRNNDDQENGNNDDCNNNDDDDDDDNLLYSEVAATKKRKKGTRSKPMTSKKRKPKGTTKRNNNSRHNSNTSINHDFVVCGKGDADVEGDAEGEESDEDVDLFKERRYEKTNAANWTKHKNGQPRRVIHPIPVTGTSEFFHPNISDIEMKEMIDEHGNIRFHKIFEWMLPTFYGESFYECLSARMCNYMVHSIKSKGQMPCYYWPADGKVIVADDVACFFGCQIARSLRGNPSIACTWLTREPLDAIGTCMNPCQRWPSETSITVFILAIIGTRTTNEARSTQTKNEAVPRTWRITARSSPCARTASTVGGRSVSSWDAGSPLTRAMSQAGTTAPSHKGQIQSLFAPVHQSTHWQLRTVTSRRTKCTFACLVKRRTRIWVNKTRTPSPTKSR